MTKRINENGLFNVSTFNESNIKIRYYVQVSNHKKISILVKVFSFQTAV